MATRKEAVIAFKMDTGQLQSGVRRARNSLQGFYQWTRNMRSGLLGMNNMLMGSGAVMVGAGLAARSAVRSYERFSNANARLRGILASTGSSMRLQTGMLQSAEVAARRYGFGLGESTEAMGTLLETGVSAHEAMRYFGTISQFARASNSDLDSATQVVVDSMRQFNDMSEEGANRLAATITVAARLSSTSIPQLQQAFRYAGVELAAMGFKADETAAALGALSSIGLRGTTAGTRLRGSLLALTRITERSRDIMRENNLEHERLDRVLTDETGSLRPLTEVSDELTQIFRELPTHQAKLNLATSLFGRRAYAAGVILAGLHPRANDFRDVLEELSDSEENVNRMQEAANENTRGFGAQLRLARVAVEDFGITFMRMLVGPFEESEGGFGQFLSNLALATRVAGMASEPTGILAEQYAELTPEMRENGRELRNTLEGLAELLRIIGRIGLAIGEFAGRWPRLTTALLITGSILRPLIGMFGVQMGAALLRMGVALNAATVRMTSFTIAGHAAGTTLGGLIAFWALAIPLALALGDVLGEHIAGIMGVSEEYDRYGRETEQYLEAAGMGWAAQTPIISNVARTIGRVILATKELISTNRTLEAQRETQRQRETADVNTRIEARMARVRGGEATRSQQYGYARMRATNLEMREDLMRMAALTHGRFGSTEGQVRAIQQILQRGGVSASRAQGMQGQIEQAIQNVSALGDAERRRVESLGHSTTSLAESIRQLTIASDDAAAAFRRGSGMTEGEFAGLASTRGGGGTAGDVMVSSSGYLPFRVSAGDMLVHRGELARAMAGGRGEMVHGSSQQVSATPSPGGAIGGGTIEAEFTIPVTIDSREVARAVGTRSLEVNQRRGSRPQAGAGRRVAETGVQ